MKKSQIQQLVFPKPPWFLEPKLFEKGSISTQFVDFYFAIKYFSIQLKILIY